MRKFFPQGTLSYLAENRFNTETLKNIANSWSERFSAIRSVILFKHPAGTEWGPFGYGLLVEYDESNPGEAKKFKRWSRGRKDCRHVINELAVAYKRRVQGAAWKNEWTWYQQPYEEKFYPDLLVSKKFIVLYGRVEHESCTIEPSPLKERSREKPLIGLQEATPAPSGEVQGEPEERTKEETDTHTPQLEANANLPYPTKVLSLMRKACPEIEKLWGGILSISGTLTKEGSRYVRYQEAALTFHEKNKDSFKIIEKKDLEDSSVFFPSSENPEERHLKRNIEGKLYQEIISRTFPQELPEPGGKQGYSIKGLSAFHKAELDKISPTSPQLRPSFAPTLPKRTA